MDNHKPRQPPMTNNTVPIAPAPSMNLGASFGGGSHDEQSSEGLFFPFPPTHNDSTATIHGLNNGISGLAQNRKDDIQPREERTRAFTNFVPLAMKPEPVRQLPNDALKKEKKSSILDDLNLAMEAISSEAKKSHGASRSQTGVNPFSDINAPELFFPEAIPNAPVSGVRSTSVHEPATLSDFNFSPGPIEGGRVNSLQPKSIKKLSPRNQPSKQKPERTPRKRERPPKPNATMETIAIRPSIVPEGTPPGVLPNITPSLFNHGGTKSSTPISSLDSRTLQSSAATSRPTPPPQGQQAMMQAPTGGSLANAQHHPNVGSGHYSSKQQGSQAMRIHVENQLRSLLATQDHLQTHVRHLISSNENPPQEVLRTLVQVKSNVEQLRREARRLRMPTAGVSEMNLPAAQQGMGPPTNQSGRSSVAHTPLVADVGHGGRSKTDVGTSVAMRLSNRAGTSLASQGEPQPFSSNVAQVSHLHPILTTSEPTSSSNMVEERHKMMERALEQKRLLEENQRRQAEVAAAARRQQEQARRVEATRLAERERQLAIEKAKQAKAALQEAQLEKLNQENIRKRVRLEGTPTKDQLRALNPDIMTPFRNLVEVWQRLSPYHVFGMIDTEAMDDEEWDKKLGEVTSSYANDFRSIQTRLGSTLQRFDGGESSENREAGMPLSSLEELLLTRQLLDEEMELRLAIVEELDMSPSKVTDPGSTAPPPKSVFSG
uniref:GLTSCR protein conserved domain-containing protein n=1 Tax=Compsopogon caeruleus TaxID=31354 RepID=A0A6T6AME4_9RHOD|mmetsp:Transcript_11580/g.23532  ORF Transcript_11580/g.23532 Transcript_11580/m.23532 type:complete len:717 (+) Transcript_11580:1371-3521(+)